MPDKFKVNIAGITFLVQNMAETPELGIPETHEKFVVTKDDLHPDVTLHSYYSEPPVIEDKPVIFDSGASWCLYGDNGTRIFRFCSPVLNQKSHRVMILSADYRSGDLYVMPWITWNDGRYYPFDYPIDEVLMINLLASGLGVIIHSCGLINNEKGILFVGTSGAGKTTTANLWKNIANTTILSDDRMILRIHQNKVWMYGTPWHGTARLASPQGVPVDRIYFLKKYESNYVERKEPAAVVKQLFVACFPTFWNPTGMTNTLRQLHEVADSVPSYDFGFTPDNFAVNFLRTQLE